MEVLPCSRVAHIARMKKPYHSNIAFHTRRNALRVAEVWMDEYKSNVYLAWNIPMEVRTAFFCRKTSLREDALSHACLFVTIRCPYFHVLRIDFQSQTVFLLVPQFM